jgi:uncharacterized protein (UPF0216 family)
MVEERVMERWIATEMLRLQEGFVPAPRPLHELMLEEAPSAATRKGDRHAFDKPALARIHAALGPLDRRRLRLPVTFYVDKEMPDDAYTVDEVAARLLRALGEVPADVEMREGKLWLSHGKARMVADRHRGAFQFVHI